MMYIDIELQLGGNSSTPWTRVAASTDNLVLVTLPATVWHSTVVFITARVHNLTLATYPASVVQDWNILAGFQAMTVAPLKASVGVDNNIACDFDALTITTYPAIVSENNEDWLLFLATMWASGGI